MAATDKPYRDQNTLDIVFAVSSILMLISIVWMFMDDYNREFKTEQRTFRDVEAALAQRQALDQMPNFDEFEKAEQAVKLARYYRYPEELEREVEDLRGRLQRAKDKQAPTARIEALEKNLKDAESAIDIEQAKKDKEAYREARKKSGELLPLKERSEQAYQAVKAELDSKSSFYDIEVDEHGPESNKAKELNAVIDGLKSDVAKAQANRDKIASDLKDLQAGTDRYEAPLTKAISNWKKVNDKFDTQVKLALNKQWGVGDMVRNLPILDSFAPPLKIHQFTINDIPIDYNFKYVTRFDRCMSCHQGIDRPAFARSRLKELTRVSSEYEQKLADAHEILKRRGPEGEALKGLPESEMVPNWKKLHLTKVSKSQLNEARITEFCAHPRLDLFVGPNSKHPAEKFGCTSCHSGQGSATSFTLASHTPSTSAAKERWQKEHGWEAIHMWDFPMQPVRFVESSCLKCHHQVTDLIASDNRNEAPKLVRGFNLIKENGCFGCHEIHGRKGGRQVGPDLRLEATPPVESLAASERARIEADLDNAPGNLRKVGPSLNRLSQKTHPEWVAKWLRSPRGFRPDTKMPHFYNVSNNDKKALAGTGQESFPDTEMWALTNYLFGASEAYLKEIAAGEEDLARLGELQRLPSRTDADKKELEELSVRIRRVAELRGMPKLTDGERKELDALNERAHKRNVPVLKDLTPKDHKPSADRGRALFSTRGCLACHSHSALEKPQGNSGDKNYEPALFGEAQFGPSLSQITEKLGMKKGDLASARAWLIQWVLNPQQHSPRSRMPVTHLDHGEAADLAEWLLQQKASDLGPEWAEAAPVVPGEDELKKLASVYLVRLLAQTDMDRFLKDGTMREEVKADLPAEEKELAANFSDASLKRYLGKKAVGRLGCYACHDIAGFDNAKPIGVGLNDWGKKASDRLAFEDIMHFVKDHYDVVDSLDKNGAAAPGEQHQGHQTRKGKMPYEKFYYEALEHKQREGYLNQKIIHPRSFDYNRLKSWDDRARMPQFRFARTHRKDKESAEDYEARAAREEAEGREAVATFILGLVAEPVPTASINQPKGDRLAEVKGRQVLDKYNCGGCHLVRSGVFEFKVSDDSLRKMLEAVPKSKLDTDHDFPFHANWRGKSPAAPDRLLAMGARPRLLVDEDDPNSKTAEFRLTRALHFQGMDKKPKDIWAETSLSLNPRDMVYPPPPAWESNATLAAFLSDKGPYGGAFANLLVDYLVAKDKSKTTPLFTREQDGDSSKARAAVPPILLGQGERTQTEWLFQFLLNPQPVRRMTVLRMPKFNMSQEEARVLVDYFAAAERAENPGIGLKYPYAEIPQHDAFSTGYWLARNSEYVARLKLAKTLDAAGKETTVYENRRKELTPVWERILEDLKTKHTAAKSKRDAAEARVAEAKKTLDAESSKEKKVILDAAFKEEERIAKAWEAELGVLDTELRKSTLEKQQAVWESEQAYVSDGLRLLAGNRLPCASCHQVDKAPVKNDTEGPPLYLTHERLQPDWLQRWIAAPHRFLTYGSSMPNNFAANQLENQDVFPGSPLEQLTAVRDALMVYPRVAALPINQSWALPMLNGAKAADSKEGAKKAPEKKTGDKQ